MNLPESRTRREARRVRVSAPPRPSSGPVVAVRELAESTPVGEFYLRSLMRSQLNLALAILTVFVVFLAGIPLLFALVPSFAKVKLLTVPIIWLILGVSVPPFLLALGGIYNRLAERNEAEFVDLVTESPERRAFDRERAQHGEPSRQASREPSRKQSRGQHVEASREQSRDRGQNSDVGESRTREPR